MMKKQQNPSTMPITDPKQNFHHWWGELTIDEDTEIINGGTIAPQTRCIFVKTSYDSHHLSHGTFIKKVRLFNNKTDVTKAIRSKSHFDITDMDDDMDFPDNVPIVEILEVNIDRTSPLTNAVNEFIENLFWDDQWLDKATPIGQDKIRIGRSMAGLRRQPKK
jgi:hypothetical protein